MHTVHTVHTAKRFFIRSVYSNNTTGKYTVSEQFTKFERSNSVYRKRTKRNKMSTKINKRVACKYVKRKQWKKKTRATRHYVTIRRISDNATKIPTIQLKRITVTKLLNFYIFRVLQNTFNKDSLENLYVRDYASNESKGESFLRAWNVHRNGS